MREGEPVCLYLCVCEREDWVSQGCCEGGGGACVFVSGYVCVCETARERTGWCERERTGCCVSPSVPVLSVQTEVKSS